MRIWRLVEPLEARFACARRLGTWEPVGRQAGLCPGCGDAPAVSPVPPLVISWKPSSDVVGDFVWDPATPAPVAMTAAVYEQITRAFRGLEGGPVEMTECKRTDDRRRSEPKVSLPYKGPPLCAVRTVLSVRADLSRSTVRCVFKCETCGRERYEVDGIEKRYSRWNVKKQALDVVHEPRQSGHGLVVSTGQLQNASFFAVQEFPGRMLCTDQVRQFIEERCFNNVAFLEVGEVI
jgi:hypothetical protein